jgi:hypothetical protein
LGDWAGVMEGDGKVVWRRGRRRAIMMTDSPARSSPAGWRGRGRSLAPRSSARSLVALQKPVKYEN